MVDRVKHVMSAVLGVAEETIDESMTPASFERWDSLAHINLVMALEEEFGVSFDDHQIARLTSLAAITREVAGG